MLNFLKNKNCKRGFLTVEVIVAVSIIVVATLVSLSVAERSIKVARRTLNTSQAVFLLEEGKEVVRIIRDGAWSNVSNLSTSSTYYPFFTSGAWTLTTEPRSVGIFTRTVTVANVARDGSSDIASSGTNDTGTRRVTVTVTWNDAGVVLSKSISFYITDIFS